MERKKNLLLIDDDEELGNLLRDFLSHHNLNLEMINNGEDGIQELEILQLSSKGYDLVILDIMLPGISGLEVLKLSLIHI